MCDPATPLDLRIRMCATFIGQVDALVADHPDEAGGSQLVERYDAALHDDLLPTLVENGLQVVKWAALNQFERVRVRQMFEQQIYPLLTPMTVDATHPFPRVPDLSLSLAVRIREPLRGPTRFVCVTLPRGLPRCMAVRGGCVVTVESVICALLPVVLVGVEVIECSCFRVTRSKREGSAPGVDTGAVVAGRSRPVVRLEIEEGTSRQVVDLLGEQLGVPTTRVHRMRSSLAMGTALDVGVPSSRLAPRP